MAVHGGIQAGLLRSSPESGDSENDLFLKKSSVWISNSRSSRRESDRASGRLACHEDQTNAPMERDPWTPEGLLLPVGYKLGETSDFCASNINTRPSRLSTVHAIAPGAPERGRNASNKRPPCWRSPPTSDSVVEPRDELISRSFPHRYELISRNNDVFGKRATRDGPSGASEGRRPTSPRLYAPQRAPHSQ
jgi:hypothetical protein